MKRLPLIVSGAGVNQLIGVPQLINSTGVAQSTAVSSLLDEWGINNRVVAMCFDSTASNTGHANGACMQLVKKLGKKLLQFTCRHHMYEIVLGSIFKESK